MKKRLFRVLFFMMCITSYLPGDGQVTWIPCQNIGDLTRDGAVGFSIGDKGYVLSGRCHESTQFLNDTWEYDPQNDTWTQKADFPSQSRSGAIGFAIDGKGYFGLGNYSSNGVFYYLDDFWEYDPIANQWSQKGEFPGGERYGALGLATETKGYILAGYNGSQDETSVWEYSPETDTWLQKHDYPGNAFVRLSGFVINSELYAGCGGVDTLNEFWNYNPQSDTWTERTPIPVARTAAVGFSIGNTGYIGTGDAGFISKSASDLSYNDFWAYDPVLDSWTQFSGQNGGPGRSNAVGFSIGLFGFVGTGTDYYSTWGVVNYYNDFWMLDFSVGVDDHSKGLGISGYLSAYPNPVSGNYIVVRNGLEGGTGTLSLVSADGQVVWNNQVEPCSEIRVAAGNLPKGLYFLRLYQNESVKETTKIILQ